MKHFLTHDKGVIFPNPSYSFMPQVIFWEIKNPASN